MQGSPRVVREWLAKALVELADKAAVPLWAIHLHRARAWQVMSYREVRMVADDATMQEAVEAAWRLNGANGVRGMIANAFVQGSR